MSGYTREQLAERSGVPVQDLDRLVELGILVPDDDGPPFSGGDVRRAKFVHGLAQGGLPVEAVATAVRNGDLSFAFFDLPYWERFGGLVGTTYRDVSTESGIGLELLLSVREAMGYARPDPDDQLREDELIQVELAKVSLAAGADPAAMERQIRVWGENVRRIAEADSTWYRTQIETPLLRSGLTEAQVLQVASEAVASIAPLVDEALVAMYRAQSEHTWMANVVEAVEATLERVGLHRTAARPPAVCFLDLSGYTRLTEELGDRAAAEMAGTLGRLVQRGSHAYGGRPVKWLGDGVMLHFRDPGAAVVSALQLVEEIPAGGLPPAHVGIDAGPVIFQDGDYFGRTVNRAARIAAHASAGQVLVSDEVLRTTTDRDVTFHEIGPVELKGISRPVRLHRASLDGRRS